METTSPTNLRAPSVALAIWEILSTAFLFSQNISRALSLFLMVNRTWLQCASRLLWCQRLNGTKCYRMLEAFKCPYRQQMYTDRVIELYDVYPSIIFAGFTQLSMCDQSHGFEYYSHMWLYDRSTSDFHVLRFLKLAFLSLSDNGLDDVSSSAAFVRAISHLFGPRLW